MHTQFGEISFNIKNNVITAETEDNTLGGSDIEMAMQNYLYQNPDGGKFGQNEVQRAEYFKDENIWSALIF